MRTTCLTVGFTLTALLCGTANAADPRLLNLVMPDANTLAGANVTSAEISPFGQYILSQLTTSVAANQELQKFITATGFDPRHDVSEVLAASSGNATTPSGLVLALGNFNVAQLTAAVGAQAPELGIQTYNGATLISGVAGKISFSVAFLGGSIAILGDSASVKAAIDRSSGANSINPALAVQVQALSMTQDAWVVSTNPLASLIPGLGTSATGPAQLFSSIQSSSGGIKFGSVVAITGQAVVKDAATAKSMADLMQALASILSMAGGQDPQVAAMAQLLQGLKVTSDGATVHLALSVPEAQLETVLTGLKNQAKPAAKTTLLKPAAFAVN